MNASKQWSGTHKELRKKSEKLKNAAKKIIDKHISSDSNKNSGNKIPGDQQQTIDTLMNPAWGKESVRKAGVLLLQNLHFLHPCRSSTK